MNGLLRSFACGLFLLLVTCCSVSAHAYSLLTHQELIDLAWNGLSQLDGEKKD